MNDDTRNGIDLAAAISSRICHDLVSPVGAIVNGIDLVREIGTTGVDEEIAMIGQSAGRASDLLQFYRLAFGAANDGSQDVGRAALCDQARAMINWQRISLEWEHAAGPAVSRKEAKLICQLLLCARSVAGMSGVITVRLGIGETFPMEIRVASQGAPDADERLQLLVGAVDLGAPTARLVEFSLARECAAELGVRIETPRTPAAIVLRASLD